MKREQIIEILNFYEDPAEDLNHNIRSAALFSHLYEDVADEILDLLQKEQQLAKDETPSKVGAEELDSPDEFARKHFFKGNMRISAPFKVPEPQVYHMMRAYAEYVRKYAQQAQGDEWVSVIRNSRLVQKLGQCYRRSDNHRIVIAELCDEYLDKSGGLLGRVRKYAPPKTDK